MLVVGIFNVRVVLPGDKYGRDDCFTLEEGQKTLVEFYDGTQDPAKFGDRGQFVSRYYCSTITSADSGMCLHGCVAAWRVTDEQMKRIKAYLQGFAEGRARV
jgi:hypothetical protein